MAYQLLAMENPLLDIQCYPKAELLEKYGLKANDAILAEDKHRPLYDEIVKDYEVVYVAGGASQNVARGAQRLLPPNSVLYIGCVSDDKFASEMKVAAAKDGLKTHYMITKEVPTGTCAVLLTGHHRSLVANLSAAEKFDFEWLRQPEQWQHVENAKCFYIGAFFITHDGGNASTLAVGKHAAETGKTFAMNLSAPFVPQFFKQRLDQYVPNIDILFANDDEAKAFAAASGWETQDPKEIALKITELPKANTKRPRIVVFTQGARETIVASNGQVQTFPIIPIEEKDIVDTNGAGDAFAAGFMGMWASGEEDLAKCVAAGHWLANIGIQQVGPTYPADLKVPTF